MFRWNFQYFRSYRKNDFFKSVKVLNPTQVYVEESDNDDISSIVTVDAPLSTIITSQDPPDVSSVSIGPAEIPSEISNNVQSRSVVTFFYTV